MPTLGTRAKVQKPPAAVMLSGQRAGHCYHKPTARSEQRKTASEELIVVPGRDEFEDIFSETEIVAANGD